MTVRPLTAGNWKMNGLQSSIMELDRIVAGATPELAAATDLLICPPATLIAAFAARARGTPVAIGAQDCHPDPKGAHTGDIAAEMLADAGARAIIVGHSERRTDHHETDAVVRAKAAAVFRVGLTAILCVGESRAQREAGHALEVVEAQLRGSIPDGAPADRLVVAYEPVWAIGTGLVPTLAEIGAVHAHIRRWLETNVKAGRSVRILYGGSVKPDNCQVILTAPEVNGALIGGASLNPADFLSIACAYSAKSGD